MRNDKTIFTEKFKYNDKSELFVKESYCKAEEYRIITKSAYGALKNKDLLGKMEL